MSTLRASDYGQVYNTGEGIYINTYACSSELNPDKECDGIGTVCHEFSHCLGFADMYDTTYSGGYGMDDWDLLHLAATTATASARRFHRLREVGGRLDRANRAGEEPGHFEHETAQRGW